MEDSVGFYKLYGNLLRIDVLKFLNTEEFRFFLIENILLEDWEMFLDFSKIKESDEIIEITGNYFTYDLEKAFFQFINKILNEKKDEMFLDFVKEFIIWKQDSFDSVRLVKTLNEWFGSLADDLIATANYKSKINSKKQDLEETEIHLQKASNQLFEDLHTKKAENINKKIFIVHGHDKVSKLEIKEFIKDIGLEPIIIQDQPNDTMQTIISKFEKSANQCSAAIILATPDDKSDNKFRARQNVILEFGYFLGIWKKGNRKIIIIKKGDVEIPSDISGVIYHSYNLEVKEIFNDLRNQFKYWKYEIK
ncbi:MAG TPA: hypothetical protein DCS66_23960 [Flavobacteriaceae bacterium]|nr:hypothetical protein [Flavobacteriaceae bacterium]|tara:strand:- start:103 stop:1023 length:921 start_codon:yes stop_codon:yes gene_type:complete